MSGVWTRGPKCVRRNTVWSQGWEKKRGGPRAGFLSMSLCSHRDLHRKDPALSWMFCYWCFNKYIFEFVLQKWSLIGQWSMHVSKGCTFNMQAQDCSLPPYLHTVIHSAPWAQTLVESTMHCIQWDSKQIQVGMLALWLSGDTDSPGRPCFPFEPGLALNAERKHWHSKKQDWLTNSTIFFLIHVIYPY